MPEQKDMLALIIDRRLAGKRTIIPDELEPSAAESFLIAAHVDQFRFRLSPSDTPFSVLGFENRVIIL